MKTQEMRKKTMFDHKKIGENATTIETEAKRSAQTGSKQREHDASLSDLRRKWEKFVWFRQNCEKNMLRLQKNAGKPSVWDKIGGKCDKTRNRFQTHYVRPTKSEEIVGLQKKIRKWDQSHNMWQKLK